MVEQELRIEVVLHRKDPGSCELLNDVDVGSLIGRLLEQWDPYVFPAHDLGGSIKAHVQRTHEYEIVLYLLLAGTTVFLKSALNRLGQHFGDWLAEQMGLLNTTVNSEIRVSDRSFVSVDPDKLEECIPDIVEALRLAGENAQKLNIAIEPISTLEQ